MRSVVNWQLRSATGPVPGFAGAGPSPLTVTLDGAPDGRLELVAGQTSPLDPVSAVRALVIDTTPPVIVVARPVAGAAYTVGERVTADFSCGAATCQGTVASGSPIDTASVGTRTFTVSGTDAAGNAATERVIYRVVAAPTPPPPAGPAGTPAPPSPPIRLAPPSPSEPEDAVPTVSDADRLRPPAAAALNIRRPVLRWTRVRGARLYNVQIFRIRGDAATKVLSAFPRGNRYRVPAGVLTFGERYVWRVWPLVRESYGASPHGQSWFDVRRPLRLTPAQLLVNQRISQAALRRTAAIAAWLDAGLVTDDLRAGGLGRADFAPDVTLSGSGDAIENGFATPRPVVVAAVTRSTTARVRVNAAQLLVNQRISQAAVRRANALERRIDGRLTGGDLREGVVVATTLAPGLSVASARPAGPAPARSSSAVATPSRTGRPAVRATARQVLINQRISQAAVRRANAMTELIGKGLTGSHFRDGTVSAVSVSPALRS